MQFHSFAKYHLPLTQFALFLYHCTGVGQEKKLLIFLSLRLSYLLPILKLHNTISKCPILMYTFLLNIDFV